MSPSDDHVTAALRLLEPTVLVHEGAHYQEFCAQRRMSTSVWISVTCVHRVAIQVPCCGRLRSVRGGRDTAEPGVNQSWSWR